MADNIPLINGQRIETSKRTSGGVVVHTPHYRAVDSEVASAVFMTTLKLDGLGSIEMNVDGTVPKKFSTICPASTIMTVRALSIAIGDDAALVPSGIGALAALGTGILIDVIGTDAAAVVADLTGGMLVKSHADLMALGAAVAFVEPASGTRYASIRWAFPVPIEVGAAQRFQVTIRDNLSTLVSMRATISGSSRAV